MSRVKADEAQTPEQTVQVLKHIQQYLMAHPPIAEDHFTEMVQLSRKLNNEKMVEQAKASRTLYICRKSLSASMFPYVKLKSPKHFFKF
jgi:hypothetical protein